jgi:hypothetical protein
MNSLQPGRTSLLALAALGLSQSLPAQADQVIPVGGVTLVSGTSSQTVAIPVTTPGTLTVTLENLPFQQPLAGSLDSLSFLMSTALTPLDSSWNQVSLTDTQSYNVGPGTYFAHITGQAGGTLDLGIYSLSVTFQSAVPLPASWMLLTGVFVLMGLARFGGSLRGADGEATGAGTVAA